MKVVHITPSYFSAESHLGGGERFPLELAKAMSAYVETRVVSFGPEAKTVVLSEKVSMRIYENWNKKKYANPINPFFLKEVFEADVVHCHQYLTIAANLSIIFGKLAGKKVFATDLGGGGRNLAFYINLTRWLDGYLLISKNSAELAKDCLAPIHIIYAGVDTAFYKPTRPKEKKVVCVGRFLPHKGIDYLIEAMPSDIPLHIIGTPYDERYYQDLKKLAEGKKVSFLIGLSHEQIVDEYSSAMVCVMPAVAHNRYGGVSNGAQLFALPLVEAMACKTVPIATNLFAHPEIIQESITGFLVPPNDPPKLRERIEYVLKNPSEAAKMGERGREEVLRRFTWEKVAQRCLEIYRK